MLLRCQPVGSQPIGPKANGTIGLDNLSWYPETGGSSTCRPFFCRVSCSQSTSGGGVQARTSGIILEEAELVVLRHLPLKSLFESSS